MSVARKGVWMALVAVVCAVGLLAGAGSALAETKTFSYTGKEQEFKVPAGVTVVHVVAIGSEGGSAGGAGGVGAIVNGKLTVKPEQKLYVEVGGVPFNGGGTSENSGSGGGASDVREVSIGTEPSPGNEESLNSRLLVAAGGGGGGAASPGFVQSPCAGGAGGVAEEKGTNGTNCGFPPGEGGGAGEATKGGAGGLGYSGESANSAANGEAGKLGAGGGLFGGGGGGGRYGGGGGGFQSAEGSGPPNQSAGAGGGGGGSNLVPKGGEAKLAKAKEASSVTITYTVPPSTTLSTSLSGEGKSGENLTVKVGAFVADQATLSGENASKAGGTVTYNQYLDSNCEQVLEEIETVTVSGGSVPRTGIEFNFGQPVTTYFAATYSGDENNAPSKSKCEVLTVVPQPKPTTLKTSLSGEGKTGEQLTVDFGTFVTDHATLSGENAAQATGKVSYNLYSDSECKHLLAKEGEVSVSSGSVPESSPVGRNVGTYYWQAEYSGDESSGNEASKSKCGAEVQTVVAAPTATKTTLSGEGKSGEKIAVKEGASVSDTATMSTAVAGEAEGTVTYSVYSDKECKNLVKQAGAVAVSAGAALPSESQTLSAGTYYWQAEYSGDANNEESSSKCGAEVLTVAQATTTTVKCSPASFLLGQSTTCTATVADTASSGGAPTGTVDFKTSKEGPFSPEAKCTLGAPTTNSSSCSVTYKPTEKTKQLERSDEITAEYESDETHEKSKDTTTVTVLTHETATSVKCSPASFVAGGSTKCTATVKDKATSGATTPTGNVAFKTSGSGSFSNASCTLAGSGATASCEVTYKPTATPKEPERSDTITATYEGDEAHEGSKGTTSVTVISYSQTISGSVGGNLVVKAGQSVLLSSKARIEGNVTVTPGGALDVEGARIEGGISANKSTRVRMCGAGIEGSLMASNGTGKVAIGEGTTSCPGNAIEGNLTVTGNSAGVRIVGNTIDGNLMVTANAGGATVTKNTVHGNLTVTGNTGTVLDKPNTVEGNSTLQ
jgi:hypothetical protein